MVSVFLKWSISCVSHWFEKNNFLALYQPQICFQPSFYFWFLCTGSYCLYCLCFLLSTTPVQCELDFISIFFTKTLLAKVVSDILLLMLTKSVIHIQSYIVLCLVHIFISFPHSFACFTLLLFSPLFLWARYCFFPDLQPYFLSIKSAL